MILHGDCSIMIELSKKMLPPFPLAPILNGNVIYKITTEVLNRVKVRNLTEDIETKVKKYLIHKTPFNNYQLSIDNLYSEIIAGKDTREVITGLFHQEIATALLRKRFKHYATPQKGLAIKQNENNKCFFERGNRSRGDNAIACDHAFIYNNTVYLIEQKSSWNACNSDQLRSIEKSFKNLTNHWSSKFPQKTVICVLCYGTGTINWYGKNKSKKKYTYYHTYGETTWEFFTGNKNTLKIILESTIKCDPFKNYFNNKEIKFAIIRMLNKIVCDNKGHIDFKKWLNICSPSNID